MSTGHARGYRGSVRRMATNDSATTTGAHNNMTTTTTTRELWCAFKRYRRAPGTVANPATFPDAWYMWPTTGRAYAAQMVNAARYWRHDVSEHRAFIAAARDASTYAAIRLPL